MSDSAPSPKNIQNYVFGAILVLLFIMVCKLFAPFLTVLLWSILLYILLNPLHHRLVKNIRGNKPGAVILKNIIAAFFSLATVVLIMGPLSFVAFQFFRQITELIRTARDMLDANPGFFQDALREASRIVGDISSGFITIDPGAIQNQITLTLTSSLQNLVQLSSAVARNVGSFFLGLAFMIFCLFFFYLDGAYLSRLVLHAIPIRKEYVAALTGKFKDITRNLFLGYIMVALVQAVMGYIIFTIFAVRGALVFAVLTLICSFIPMFGAGIVWLPIGLARLFGGDIGGAVLFLAVSGIFISTLDNFLRPFFLRDRIKLHPLFIFVSILGGVMTFGFNGLVLGPMVVILFLTVLDLFLAEHKLERE
jgi:predicted PurR-regulated permease PerM